MSFRLLAITAAAAALMVAPAMAQNQPAKPAPGKPAAPAGAAAPAAPDANASTTPAISGPQPDWVKLCSNDPQTKKDICQTSRDLRAETGQTLASVALREEKGGKRMLILAIPPGMQIQPGVRVVIDQQQPVMGRYSVCFPNVCLVELEATEALVNNMKKGTTLNLQALSVQARGVVFPIGLNGFGKAYDGPPLDPKVVQADQEKLRKQLEEAAAKAREQAGQQPAQ